MLLSCLRHCNTFLRIAGLVSAQTLACWLCHCNMTCECYRERSSHGALVEYSSDEVLPSQGEGELKVLHRILHPWADVQPSDTHIVFGGTGPCFRA